MTAADLPLVTPDRLDTLYQHAADLDLDVEWTHALPELQRGRYLDHSRTILLAHGLTRVQTISTLAHELGHALYRDLCSTRATERRAWELAGALTITVADYAAAERLVGSHTGALAVELEVTPIVIDGWRRWYVRTSGSRLALRVERQLGGGNLVEAGDP